MPADRKPSLNQLPIVEVRVQRKADQCLAEVAPLRVLFTVELRASWFGLVALDVPNNCQIMNILH